MNITVDRPPVYDRCVAAFGPLPPGVIFAYGDAVYAPDGGPLTLELRAHEAVHLRRQAGEPEAWWERYLVDPEFRLQEEVPAHAAEYHEFCAHCHSVAKRATYLQEISRRLASPMYALGVTTQVARGLIKKALVEVA